MRKTQNLEDGHNVCTAVIHTHECELDRLKSKARGPIYSNLHRDSIGTKECVAGRCSHLSRCYRPLKVSFAQYVCITLRCRITISRSVSPGKPVARQSDCTHKLARVMPAWPLVHSQANSPEWPEGSRPGGPIDSSDESPGADTVSREHLVPRPPTAQPKMTRGQPKLVTAGPSRWTALLARTCVRPLPARLTRQCSIVACGSISGG